MERTSRSRFAAWASCCKRCSDIRSRRFNFDSSSNLAAQIQQGAPADVFASADEANLQKAVDSGDITARSGGPAVGRPRRGAVFQT